MNYSCNIVTFRIEVTWQVRWQVLILTSTFTFSSKTLLHRINDATGLSKKILLASKNICDSEGVFSLIDTYAT